MYYLLFYWIFSSLFAYNFIRDKDTKLLGYHLFMIVLSTLFGMAILPISLGLAVDKILNS